MFDSWQQTNVIHHALYFIEPTSVCNSLAKPAWDLINGPNLNLSGTLKRNVLSMYKEGKNYELCKLNVERHIRVSSATPSLTAEHRTIASQEFLPGK